MIAALAFFLAAIAALCAVVAVAAVVVGARADREPLQVDPQAVARARAAARAEWDAQSSQSERLASIAADVAALRSRVVSTPPVHTR